MQYSAGGDYMYTTRYTAKVWPIKDKGPHSEVQVYVYNSENPLALISGTVFENISWDTPSAFCSYEMATKAPGPGVEDQGTVVLLFTVC